MAAEAAEPLSLRINANIKLLISQVMSVPCARPGPIEFIGPDVESINQCRPSGWPWSTFPFIHPSIQPSVMHCIPSHCILSHPVLSCPICPICPIPWHPIDISWTHQGKDQPGISTRTRTRTRTRLVPAQPHSCPSSPVWSGLLLQPSPPSPPPCLQSFFLSSPVCLCSLFLPLPLRCRPFASRST